MGASRLLVRVPNGKAAAADFDSLYRFEGHCASHPRVLIPLPKAAPFMGGDAALAAAGEISQPTANIHERHRNSKHNASRK
jgi:hypothetical protein